MTRDVTQLRYTSHSITLTQTLTIDCACRAVKGEPSRSASSLDVTMQRTGHELVTRDDIFQLDCQVLNAKPGSNVMSRNRGNVTSQDARIQPKV